MKRVIQHPTTVRAARSIASDSAAMRRGTEVSLADKFNLAALNGGKSPFQVSSNSLLKTNASAGINSMSKTEKDVKDVYSLEYLLSGSGDPKKKTSAGAKKNPFDVASAKLM